MARYKTKKVRITRNYAQLAKCRNFMTVPHHREGVKKRAPCKSMGKIVRIILGQIVSNPGGLCKAKKWYVMARDSRKHDTWGRTKVWICEHQIEPA